MIDSDFIIRTARDIIVDGEEERVIGCLIAKDTL